MNSFDEIQCEETSFAQLCFDMEEMAFYQEWMEEQEQEQEQEQERETQRELDAIADQIPADHSVEFWADWS